MVSSQATRGFERLLATLHADPDAAAARYVELRAKLARMFVWKGAPESRADALADVVMDRVAAKMDAGVEVGSVESYAAGVMRFVWLEHSRKNKEDAAGDDLPEVAVRPAVDDGDDADERLGCLRKCLGEVCTSDADRRLILGYYDAREGDKNKDARRRLAEALGLSASALRVRACRLRDRLEACIRDCVGAVTEAPGGDTTRREGTR